MFNRNDGLEPLRPMRTRITRTRTLVREPRHTGRQGRAPLTWRVSVLADLEPQLGPPELIFKYAQDAAKWVEWVESRYTPQHIPAKQESLER